MLERRQYLRSLCPCRSNSSTDIEGWRELFNRARFGSYSERKAAAHSIGTLLDKAKQSDAYRELLQALQPDLDALMLDPRAASQVLGVLKKHGHAHKGAARKNYRKLYAIFSIQTEADMADWLNRRFAIQDTDRLTKDAVVVKKLVKWLNHRAKFQPERKVSESDLLKKTQLLMPTLRLKDATT